MGKDVIIALDFPGAAEAKGFLKGLGEDIEKPYVKVGMELFYSAGPDFVRELKAEGYKVFLDLKLHDIPNTVGSAMSVLAELGVDIINVHVSGGCEMMGYAAKALAECENPPLLIGVTVLTSTDDKMLKEELNVKTGMEETVIHYAQNAKKAGLGGVVCSPLEVEIVKKACGKDFVTVTPGVRFADGDVGDQKRVMTPEKANEIGSDYIVVGRAITRAEDPLAAYKRCVLEFTGRKI